MYHDASMLFDDDGRNYLVYGAGGEIKIKEFNAEMTGFRPGGADKNLFKTGLDGLSGEGSHVQKINGYYYIFLIAWPSGRIELCYRSKDLLGNYEGKTVLNSGLGTYGSGVPRVALWIRRMASGTACCFRIMAPWVESRCLCR